MGCRQQWRQAHYLTRRHKEGDPLTAQLHIVEPGVKAAADSPPGRRHKDVRRRSVRMARGPPLALRPLLLLLLRPRLVAFSCCCCCVVELGSCCAFPHAPTLLLQNIRIRLQCLDVSGQGRNVHCLGPEGRSAPACAADGGAAGNIGCRGRQLCPATTRRGGTPNWAAASLPPPTPRTPYRLVGADRRDQHQGDHQRPQPGRPVHSWPMHLRCAVLPQFPAPLIALITTSWHSWGRGRGTGRPTWPAWASTPRSSGHTEHQIGSARLHLAATEARAVRRIARWAGPPRKQARGQHAAGPRRNCWPDGSPRPEGPPPSDARACSFELISARWGARAGWQAAGVAAPVPASLHPAVHHASLPRGCGGAESSLICSPRSASHWRCRGCGRWCQCADQASGALRRAHVGTAMGLAAGSGVQGVAAPLGACQQGHTMVGNYDEGQ